MHQNHDDFCYGNGNTLFEDYDELSIGHHCIQSYQARLPRGRRSLPPLTFHIYPLPFLYQFFLPISFPSLVFLPWIKFLVAPESARVVLDTASLLCISNHITEHKPPTSYTSVNIVNIPSYCFQVCFYTYLCIFYIYIHVKRFKLLLKRFISIFYIIFSFS